MFSQQREVSQQQLGFFGFPLDCLLLAKCKMRCIGCVASPLFLVISCFVMVGDGKGEHEGFYGVCICGQGMVPDVERE